eukprot:scaffold200_cov401-Prasinococcus_capsulatus_cf.AAC.8
MREPTNTHTHSEPPPPPQSRDDWRGCTNATRRRRESVIQSNEFSPGRAPGPLFSPFTCGELFIHRAPFPPARVLVSPCESTPLPPSSLWLWRNALQRVRLCIRAM